MKPAIILANGRSLATHLERGDFDLLGKYADTFAMNQIDRLYDRTSWRPTYWVWVEQANQKDIDDRMKMVTENLVRPKKSHCYIAERFHHTLKRRFPNDYPTSSIDCSKEKLTFIKRCHNSIHGGQVGGVNIPTKWHLPVTCCYGGTMNAVIQIAFMLGYPRVGIIGADLGYHNGIGNNFDYNYSAIIDGEWSKHDATLNDMHSIARKEFEAAGREIYNCGIGGELTAYERMDLREFLHADV